MKRIILFSLVLLCSLTISAQEDGSSCLNAIPIDAYYKQSFTAGTYWFTSTTFYLPLDLYYYPEDTTKGAPGISLDLTCEHDPRTGKGIYDDPKIAAMMQTASNYGVNFPMDRAIEKVYRDGKMAWHATFNSQYRKMLYDNGVTYEVPAYISIRIRSGEYGTVEIVSTSMHSECKDETITLLMNTALPLHPSDSARIFVWPIGEWLNKDYKIYWEGEGNLLVYEGVNCAIANDQYIRGRYTMPAQEIRMTEEDSRDLVSERSTTELYMRLYPESSGLLYVEEVDTVSKITSFVVAGIPAAINQESRTITAYLPAGTDKNTAIQNAEVGIYVTDPTQNYKAYNESYTVIYVGDILSYRLLINVLESTVTTSPDASLASFTVGGVTYSAENGNFNPCQLVYDDIDVEDSYGVMPEITAVTTHPNAWTTINTSHVPGTATIVVHAEAGNTQTYQIRLVRARSRNADLDSLCVDGELIEGFNPNIILYEKQMLSIPVVTARAADPNIRDIRVYQTNRLPGYAYIEVTAEAGNKKTYTINFSLDQSAQQCVETLPALEFDHQISLSEDGETVQRFTVKDLKDEYVCLNWTGEENITVSLLQTCDVTEENLSAAVATYELTLPKGDEGSHKYYLRPADMLALSKKSLNGNLYITITSNHGTGSFYISQWEESCETRAADLNIGDTLTLPAMAHTLIYKLYDPDVQAFDTLVFTWTGESKATMYLAQTCEFNLVTTNRNVLTTHNFPAGTSTWYVTKDLWNDDIQARRSPMYMDDLFTYVRFVNNATGTLYIEGRNRKPDVEVDIIEEATICQGSEYLFAFENRSYTETTSRQYDIQSNDTVYHVNFNLTVTPLTVVYDTVKTDALPVVYQGKTITAYGETTLQFRPANDCWYNVQLNIIQKQHIYHSIDTTLCEGKTIVIGGQTLSRDGDVYTYPVVTYEDSIVHKTLILHVTPLTTSYDTIKTDALPVTYNGKTVNAYGETLLEFRPENDCWYNVRLNVIQKPHIYLNTDTTLCEGKYIKIDDEHYLMNNGDSYEYPQTEERNDTIFHHSLTLHLIPADVINDTVRPYELPITYQGIEFNNYGEFEFPYEPENDCKVIYKYWILEPDTIHLTAKEYLSTCIGQSITVNGKEYTEATTVEVTEETAPFTVTTTTYYLTFTETEYRYDTIYVTEPINVNYHGNTITTLGTYYFTLKDEELCDYTMELTVRMKENTAIPTQTVSVEVYPTLLNAGENITITAEYAGRLIITDILGRIIHSVEQTDNTTFALPNTGQYFVQFITSGGVSTTRVIVK